MATYGYVRVSTVEQANGSSLLEQRRRIQGVALTRGLVVDRFFEESGVSGSIALERRRVGYELHRALRPGDVLIVAKLDRAFRNAADALTRADEWRRVGIDLIVADMGTEPVTRDGVAKIFFGMLALVAEFERDRILERTNEGRRSKAASGGHVGGSPPFGFRTVGHGRAAKLERVPDEQAAIHTIRGLKGRESLRRIAGIVKRRHGVTISHEGVRRILRSPVGLSREW